MTDELPPGWAKASLEAVGSWGSGGTPSRGDPNAYGGSIPWLKIGDLTDGRVEQVEETITEHGLNNSSAKLLDAETLLVAMYGSIGKLGITTGACATNQAIAFCKPATGINLQYLFYLLIAERRRLVEQGQGGTQQNISQTILKAHVVPIAPTNEQQRIVSKLEELFSRIDEGERALERVQKLVERYRQSVLKAAVTGELTRDWREKNKDKLESGEALLARILKARREAWEKAELDKMKAKGITPANDKWKQKYEEPAAPDTSDLPELPTGWQWASLEQIAAPEKYAVTDGPFGSNLKTEHYTDSGPRVVRLQNIKDGAFADARAHISAAHFDQLQKHHIFAGDLLIAALGESLPRVCLVPEELGPAIVKADCVRFKASPNILAECVMAFLNSPPSRNRTKKIIHGVGRPRLNLEEIRALVVPVPSMAEQVVIADRIRIQVGLVEHMLVEQEQLSMRVTALRQSTLSRAFRGGLVQQDTNDEPASMLLKRIASTCNDAPAKPKRGRKPKTSEPA